MGWVITVVAVVVMVASYLTWTAKRVDRLHQRAAAAGRALDAQLMRRAASAAVLAEERGDGDLYALTLNAMDAAAENRDREAAENDLTRMLRKQALDAAKPADAAVITASRRVGLARQVHTDSVRDALAVRSRPLVRALRIGRRHPAPSYFDIDETSVT